MNHLSIKLLPESFREKSENIFDAVHRFSFNEERSLFPVRTWLLPSPLTSSSIVVLKDRSPLPCTVKMDNADLKLFSVINIVSKTTIDQFIKTKLKNTQNLLQLGYELFPFMYSPKVMTRFHFYELVTFFLLGHISFLHTVGLFPQISDFRYFCSKCTRIPVISLCPPHPLKLTWRHALGCCWFSGWRWRWRCHGERKSALYTTAGTG